MRSNSLLNQLAEDRTQEKNWFSVFDLLEESSHEEEKTLRRGIVTSAIAIPPVYEDFLDPWGSS
jgi:hypothetical protein